MRSLQCSAILETEVIASWRGLNIHLISSEWNGSKKNCKRELRSDCNLQKIFNSLHGRIITDGKRIIRACGIIPCLLRMEEWRMKEIGKSNPHCCAWRKRRRQTFASHVTKMLLFPTSAKAIRKVLKIF